MAYLEAAVVVYLRELYYPDGFAFPLAQIPQPILITEIGREIATIIMLATAAKFLAKARNEWFAFFAFNFGVWDIWYYIWLKILLDWPVSIMELDILFLIPIVWVGPVLAPVLVSTALIIAGYLILRFENIMFTRFDWVSEILAGMIIIASFLAQPDIIDSGQLPEDYPWIIFLIGYIIGLTVFSRRLIPAIRLKR